MSVVAREVAMLTQPALRKAVRAPRRFNRASAAAGYTRGVKAWRRQLLDETFAYCEAEGVWARLQREAAGPSLKSVAKATPDAATKELLRELREALPGLSEKELRAKADALVAAEQVRTFDAAATVALKNLGIAAEFELRSAEVKGNILARAGVAVNSTRQGMEDAVQTIVQRFYENGENPYDQAFVDDLKRDLGKTADYEAKRFALTETGIVAEQAQFEVYKRNGVGSKEWNATGVNTRDSHLELNGTVVGITEKFDVGGTAADHPLADNLPASEIVNCHCWMSPVVDERFAVEPERMWLGK